LDMELENIQGEAQALSVSRVLQNQIMIMIWRHLQARLRELHEQWFLKDTLTTSHDPWMSHSLLRYIDIRIGDVPHYLILHHLSKKGGISELKAMLSFIPDYFIFWILR